MTRLCLWSNSKYEITKPNTANIAIGIIILHLWCKIIKEVIGVRIHRSIIFVEMVTTKLIKWEDRKLWATVRATTNSTRAWIFGRIFASIIRRRRIWERIRVIGLIRKISSDMLTLKYQQLVTNKIWEIDSKLGNKVLEAAINNSKLLNRIGLKTTTEMIISWAPLSANIIKLRGKAVGLWWCTVVRWRMAGLPTGPAHSFQITNKLKLIFMGMGGKIRGKARSQRGICMRILTS